MARACSNGSATFDFSAFSGSVNCLFNWAFLFSQPATYTDLPHGDYIFRVKGSNDDGVWNEKGTSIKIIILPPWWKTWWFKIILIAGLFFIIYNWNNHRVKRLIKRAKKDATLDVFCARMKLAPQEKNILSLILIGKSNNEIADELYISLGTVKNYSSNIYKKLDVKSRGQLFNLFKEFEL